jgi:hypothetical protein
VINPGQRVAAIPFATLEEEILRLLPHVPPSDPVHPQ